MKYEIDKLKEQANASLIDIVRQYVQLSPKGKEHVGLCPFHSDTTPSLQVNPDKGIWKCFSCGAGGSGAVSFVERIEGTQNDFISTMHRIAEILNTTLEKNEYHTSARREYVEPVDAPLFELKPFTREELVLLGSPQEKTKDENGTVSWQAVWKGEEMENVFSLYSVKSYTMPPTEPGKQSIKRYSSPIYPIFTYKYTDEETGNWGRIYLPKEKNGAKFYYWPTGTPHANDPLFGDRKAMEVFEKKRLNADGSRPLANLLLCSGGSDAINAYMNLKDEDENIPQVFVKSDSPDVPNYKTPLHVCWLGSETRGLSYPNFDTMRRTAVNLYICFDQDETGIAMQNRIALQYVDIRVVQLPEGMFVKSSGRNKDIRDYFKTYNYGGRNHKAKCADFAHRIFRSIAMRFWEGKKGCDGKFNGKYEILQDGVRQFANAKNIYTYVPQNTEDIQFVRVQGNLVTFIPEKTSVRLCVKRWKHTYSTLTSITTVT
ncbi:MAG: CHC2 zinc finger domain-containing protein [Tannerellaceae bacterium]|nr:CHC2 zinc finger domain-containing protein [Tannerellaceae bacterium]